MPQRNVMPSLRSGRIARDSRSFLHDLWRSAELSFCSSRAQRCDRVMDSELRVTSKHSSSGI